MGVRQTVFIAGLLTIGCSGGKTAPVSGKVTLDGKPLADATVVFQPIGSEKSVSPGPGSQGKTDENGHYSLQVVGEGTHGAYVGKHRVEISKFVREKGEASGDRDNRSRDIVPPKYNLKTTLTRDVPPGGTQKANFDLESR
ncbi:MAG TPA: hypothetical protein VGY77_02275 [Gemmataceae bacterium]|jgi:hypothetical protein|nr:hypothetical protein [Gemmataceae bacterium]